jgi:hypothetical protein
MPNKMRFHCSCDVTCPKGTYGHACLEECNCQSGVSDGTTSCHHVTGECGSSDEATSEHRESDAAPTVLPKITTAASPVVKQADGDMATVFQPTERSPPLGNTDSAVNAPDSTSSTLTTATAFLAGEMPQQVDRHGDSEPGRPAEDPGTPEHQDARQPVPADNSAVDASRHTDSEPGRPAEGPGTPEHQDARKPVPADNSTVDATRHIDSEPGRPAEGPGAPEHQDARQPVPPARRPVIVVSDGLLSERMDEDEGGGRASGVSDLVSSASVAGAVALTLIAMATVTLLVSQRRNRARRAAADSEMASVGRQPHAQDTATLPRESLHVGNVDVLCSS